MWRLGWMTLALCVGGLTAYAEPDVDIEPAFPHLWFERPVYVGAFPGDADRLVVVEQAGRVFVFPNRAATRHARTLVDLRGEKVRREGNEEGLLGLAFHPDFQSNQQVFLHYSASRPRRNVLSRFKVDLQGPAIDVASEQVILQVDQPYSNHNGGHIAFGPDGFLYVALGDGGAGGDPHGHGQNLKTLLGTILRIDVDASQGGKPYAIPPDNPFVGRRDARDEIYAYGLRNVWRFCFDPLTQQLWAADVGQNKWEEIDLIVSGGNYGWRVREGFHAFGQPQGKQVHSFIEPIHEYGHHADGGYSITGGVVYRGQAIPALQGAYLYGDFATSHIWMLRYDISKKRVVVNQRIGQGHNPTSFGVDQHGEVYICSFGGQIFKLVPSGP